MEKVRQLKNVIIVTICLLIVLLFFVNINWLFKSSLTFFMCIFVYYIAVIYTFLFWWYKNRIIYSPCSIRIGILFCRITITKRIHFIWFINQYYFYISVSFKYVLLWTVKAIHNRHMFIAFINQLKNITIRTQLTRIKSISNHSIRWFISRLLSILRIFIAIWCL